MRQELPDQNFKTFLRGGRRNSGKANWRCREGLWMCSDGKSDVQEGGLRPGILVLIPILNPVKRALVRAVFLKGKSWAGWD
jgi:hypothetical protein